MDRGLCRSCYLLSAHLFPAHFFYIYILGNSKFSFFTSSYYNMNISIPKTFVESFMVTVLKNLLVHQLLGISNYNFFIYLCNAELILMALRKKRLTKSFAPPPVTVSFSWFFWPYIMVIYDLKRILHKEIRGLDLRQWDKMCFGYQRIKIQWKK